MDVEILNVKNVTEAEIEIEKINVHPTGIKIMALKAVHRLMKFNNIDSKTANIIKQEMLSRGGDVAISRDVGSFKANSTNLIIMGTLAQYIRLAKKLMHQPYDCKKVGEEIENYLQKYENIDLDKAPVW